MTTATFIYNDGGRKDAGYKGTAGDCAARAMAIALEIPYKQAYDELARAHRARTGQKTARKGIYKDDFETVLALYGWVWHPAPKLNGRKARCGDMPEGKVIARMARHYAAVIDGVVHDSWDSTGKMIYGYWRKA